MIDPIEIFKILGDLTRLRILHLIKEEALTVAELQEILDMGQSRISSHLAILKQAGLVSDKREGKNSYYSLNSLQNSEISELLSLAFKSSEKSEDIEQDAKNLDRALSKRRKASEAYFNMVAGKLGKNYCPGRSWESIGHMLFNLIPSVEIADLGAGEGVISQLMAKRAKAVYCIDNSPKMVEIGKELAKANGFTNLFYQLGDIEAVPLEDESVDIALFSQALHHANSPELAIEEAYRIVRPGGQIVIVDLKQHQFEKARELYADRWLGFSPNELYHWMKDIGLEHISLDTVAKEEQQPFFETLVACGSKPIL